MESLESLRSAPTVRYCSARRWRPWMFGQRRLVVFAIDLPQVPFQDMGIRVQETVKSF